MFVESAFWSHLMVWWIGKRMLGERARACVEAVLRTRYRPRAYADPILRVCRLCAESPMPFVAGATGRGCEKRIEEIMANRKRYGLTCGRKLPLAAAAVLVLTLPVVIGLVDVSQVRAQSAENPAFDVVSVKLHVGGTDRNTLVPPTVLPGGRFVSRFPLAILISYAYKTGGITGIPDWTKTPQAVYDVEATGAMPPGLSMQARDDRVRAMVQALLVDRFKLVIRRESKEMPVYALLVAKGGPKLQRADIDEKDCPEASLNALGPQSPDTPMPDLCHVFNGGVGRGLHARAANMSDLAAFVGNWTDRPLLDKTGIQGLFRFETGGYLPMDVMAAGPDVKDAATVFEMFKSLGLRMEPQKGVVEAYVVDHIERPSEN
jgi:bla regulator protein BlaR1